MSLETMKMHLKELLRLRHCAIEAQQSSNVEQLGVAVEGLLDLIIERCEEDIAVERG